MTKGEIDEICESMILDYMKKTSQTYIKCVDIEGFLITFFVKDKRKSGGAYITVTGSIDEIDEYERTIIMSNRTIIPVADIIQITGNCFDDMELF